MAAVERNRMGSKITKDKQYATTKKELLKWFLHWGTGALSMSFEDVVQTFFDDKTPIDTNKDEEIARLKMLNKTLEGALAFTRLSKEEKTKAFDETMKHILNLEPKNKEK